MPILYGMFIVFGATIEFRNADFILWITDLSLPENMITLPFRIPLYGANVGLLPLVMGATMYFQMKDTVGADPNQKMMMYFMPVFLTVLFNTLSSGLILYYTVGNFYRIVQQKITVKPEPAAVKK
jgi:YidC/Oxa1 family membrane protein insertase